MRRKCSSSGRIQFTLLLFLTTISCFSCEDSVLRNNGRVRRGTTGEKIEKWASSVSGWFSGKIRSQTTSSNQKVTDDTTTIPTQILETSPAEIEEVEEQTVIASLTRLTNSQESEGIIEETDDDDENEPKIIADEQLLDADDKDDSQIIVQSQNFDYDDFSSQKFKSEMPLKLKQLQQREEETTESQEGLASQTTASFMTENYKILEGTPQEVNAENYDESNPPPRVTVLGLGEIIGKRTM
jgi:hypothetical protein